MNKWLELFYSETKATVSTIATKADPIVANVDNVANVQALKTELEKLRLKWKACLWIRTQPHYKDLSPGCLQSEKKAYARMRSRASEIKRILSTIQHQED